MAFGQLIATIPVAGTLYNTYTTAKSVLTSSTATEASAAAIALPSGFWQRGGALRITVNGAISWASGNTMTWQVMMGAIVAFTGTHKVTTTGGTTIPFRAEFDLTCRAQGTGTLANLIGQGVIMGRMIVPNGATAGADYSAGSGIAMLPDTAPAVGTGFDSTVANTLDLWVGMGTSSASNGVQIQQYHAKAWGWLSA